MHVTNGTPNREPVGPSKIPQCIRQISHIAPFCDEHSRANFCHKIVHCGMRDWCTVGCGTGALFARCLYKYIPKISTVSVHTWALKCVNTKYFTLWWSWSNHWHWDMHLIVCIPVYSEDARVCAKWQWNSWDCRSCNPVTPVECVSLSFRTHPCVLAFITYIFCTNGIEMAPV